MRDADRLALVRERLTPCQIELQKLVRSLGNEPWYVAAKAYCNALEERFLDLEAATGCPCTPASLFEEV